MLKFIDLDSQYQRIAPDVGKGIQNVFSHGQYINGPEVRELENKLSEYVDVKHTIAVGNGTDALLIAMMALDVGPGDEVIVPDFTFIAPAEMILMLGAKPVFVDIDPKTYNLDANLLEEAITAKTKAIIAVSLFGQCADFTRINAIAEQHKIAVIEDGAQSFGATHHGKRSCGLTTIACTSFFPSKPLGCYGDGGACFTNDDLLAKKMRRICDHGQDGRYNHVVLGMNSRLDSMQAAILLAKLAVFDDEIASRQRLAAKYSELLNKDVDVPYIESHNTSVFAQYTIGCDDRAALQQKLQQHGIPTAVHYDKALHEQEVFADSVKLGNSARAAKRVMSLPFSPYLKEEDLDKVVAAILT